MALAPSVTIRKAASTEGELIAEVRRGSDRAFEDLYSSYRAQIFAYILGNVRDHGRAEDIAQEVFISALRRLRETDRKIALRPWLYEIAKNACIDEYRRGQRVREISLRTESEDGEPELESWGPTPDAAIAHKQSLSDLTGAFHSLSDSHHKVIVMRELEGLSYEQIGDRLGMTRPVVESTLFRARKRLTEEYNQLVTGRRCEQVQALIASEERRSLLKLGVKERRLLARHLSHCQPCRREARLAGIDESFFTAPQTLRGKIAALLPFPWLRRWRSGSGANEEAALASSTHSLAAIQGLQVLTRLVDPGSASVPFSRAAAAAATVAIAGIGSGMVTTPLGSHSSSTPLQTAVAAVQSMHHATHGAPSVTTSPLRPAPVAIFPVLAKPPVRASAPRRGSSPGGAHRGGATAGGSRRPLSVAKLLSKPKGPGIVNRLTSGLRSIVGKVTSHRGVPLLPHRAGSQRQPVSLQTVLPPSARSLVPKLPTIAVPSVPLPDPKKTVSSLLHGHL